MLGSLSHITDVYDQNLDISINGSGRLTNPLSPQLTAVDTSASGKGDSAGIGEASVQMLGSLSRQLLSRTAQAIASGAEGDDAAKATGLLHKVRGSWLIELQDNATDLSAGATL
jgi:hypothetical protein